MLWDPAWAQRAALASPPFLDGKDRWGLPVPAPGWMGCTPYLCSTRTRVRWTTPSCTAVPCRRLCPGGSHPAPPTSPFAPRPPTGGGRAPFLPTSAKRFSAKTGGSCRQRLSRLPAAAGAVCERGPLRLLALHGYGQSGPRFRQRTGALRKALRGRAELVPISAPHTVPGGGEGSDGEDPPRGWWFSAPGTFEAAEAAAEPAGLEESLSAVAAALAERGPFDGLLGFSQGAALAAMVCALRARGDPRFPVRFAILVAGFASRAPAHGHFYREPIGLPTLHVVGDTDAVIAASLSRELAQCFVEPVVLSHPGGHFVPAAAPQRKVYLDFLDRFCPGQGEAEPLEAGAV